MMSYVYIRTEPNLWTVGFYHGDKWEPDSDHDSPEKAAERVRWLNGDGDDNAALRRQLADLRQALEAIRLLSKSDGLTSEEWAQIDPLLPDGYADSDDLFNAIRKQACAALARYPGPDRPGQGGGGGEVTE